MRDRRLTAYQMRLKVPSRALRKDPTPAERKLLYEFLRHLPQKFTRQKPLGAYIVDFYCSSARLAVEVDGDSHFTPSAQSYDAARTRALAALRVRTIRFTNLEVTEDFEGVCQQIAAALSELMQTS